MEDGKNGNYLGKKILVVFEDGKDHYSKKVGICTFSSTTEVEIDSKDIIPKFRIVRMEVLSR